MKKVLLAAAILAALGAFALGRKHGSSPTVQSVGAGLPKGKAVPADAVARTEGAAEKREDASPEATYVPRFFPKAEVLARVSDPEDAQGRRRFIETVKTNMKEPYVRVERTFLRNGPGGGLRVTNEVAMVANQLLLLKPSGVDPSAFDKVLRTAGAIDVKRIGAEAFLATFTARPQDPRALDTYMSQVREVAGADVTVEPNYIRKLF